ncbi:MAG TPA: hypothetical protein VHB30_07540, partial [Solirubrobacteraceae bacterium]|nr:hypothetical protein [Solirubrobacteraceae bacterium]
QRHEVLARALAERLPEWRVHPCHAGWSLWVQLPGGASGDVFASAALGQGVALLGGRATSPDEEFLDHVRLCFSAPADLLVEAVERLARAWEAMPAERGSAVAV